MGVYFQLGGSAPEWATGGKRNSAVNEPNANEFKSFVQAVGTRYSGSFGGSPRAGAGRGRGRAGRGGGGWRRPADPRCPRGAGRDPGAPARGALLRLERAEPEELALA